MKNQEIKRYTVYDAEKFMNNIQNSRANQLKVWIF